MINRNESMIIDEPADIYKYPVKFDKSLGTVTLGDLHGNALKLLYFLVRSQVIKIIKNPEGDTPESQYKIFVDKYKQAGIRPEKIFPWDEDVYSKYDCTKLINELALEIVNPTHVFLIGDEFADRGNNDYITLCILEFLIDKGIPLTILASNHGIEFDLACENLITNNSFTSNTLFNSKDSILNLKSLLDNGIVSKERLVSLYEKIKPSLKLIDYTLADNEITLFTHAPVRFDVFKSIAAKIHVVYDDSTTLALAQTLDKINTKYTDIVRNNKVAELFDMTRKILDIEDFASEHIISHPFVYLVWNRWDKAKDTNDARPASLNGYMIKYVHGHDNYQCPFEHVKNLDTFFGKYETKFKDDDLRRKFGVNALNYKVMNSSQTALANKFTLEEIENEFNAVNEPTKGLRM